MRNSRPIYRGAVAQVNNANPQIITVHCVSLAGDMETVVHV